MPIKYSSREFILPNSPTELITSVKLVLDHIDQQLAGLEYKHEIYFKTKSIVTELLTNAIKHAGTKSVTIHIITDNEYLTIKKNEHGEPFPLVKDSSPGEKKKLSFDIMHSLYAINESNNTLKFIVEDNAIDKPDIDGVAEHFGLLIVTKCAEQFIYYYDEDNKLNTFTAKLRIPRP
ncbi:MAG: hypothetical protein EOP47_13000 [Sphingobacteriaceae bacterium]|nr:MAG: hypothetical protein EOP47_13000 [Sphingobacteriaceae bacterium]